jgi:hypothetical protein
MPTQFGKMVKSLGVGSGAILAPHLDIFLGDHNEFAPTIQVGGIKAGDNHFHPSGHCLMSEEDLFSNFVHPVDRELSATEKKTFDCGHMWHGYIQAALVEMGFVKQENVERHYLWDNPANPADPMKISGTVDLQDVEVPGQGTWLVDIKTASASTFNTIEQTDLFEKYRAQVNVYGDGLGAKNMLILIVRKDSPHLFREIQIQYDPKLLAGIYTRWANVSERLRNNADPGT